MNKRSGQYTLKTITLLAALLVLAAGCSSSPKIAAPSISPTPSPTPTKTAPLTDPISNARSRATKIFFGTYVTPQNSPIMPEHFTGYHTGVDFETTPAEANIDVPIYAACAGKLLVKEYATGYGGVAVQSCQLNGSPVTLIYGHLRLSSISPKVGDSLTPGEQIAVLGTGYSSETDGERKHLHFGIHIGTSVNILGYVQNKADLIGWLNPLDYLP